MSERKITIGRLKRIADYKENPCRCLKCEIDLPYDKKRNKFCSNSCSASYNNVLREKKDLTRKCFGCENRTENPKYCSNSCQQNYSWYLRKLKIESGKKFAKSEEYSRVLAKRYLIEKNGHKCAICELTKWMGKEIPLVCDHIDGNHENNLISNFRLVCGNCDMQLPTYKSKNKGNGRANRRKRYRDGKSF